VPVDIQLDTSDISGPSAGLGHDAAIIDHLTPGDLTGGKNIAVTGTIDPNGNVGEIGALEQKAVARRARREQRCSSCRPAQTIPGAPRLKDIAAAKKRAGGDVLVAPCRPRPGVAGAPRSGRGAGALVVERLRRRASARYHRRHAACDRAAVWTRARPLLQR
jgi:hypothetical protein